MSALSNNKPEPNKDNKIDLSNWMTNLSKAVTHKPIHTIAMPGSHDSFAYAISWKTKIGPDEPSLQWFNFIPIFGLIIKRLIYRWWVTQDATFTEQLNLGIRYFDLRLAMNPDTNCIHLLHGLFAMPVADALEEIASFLKSHSREIILLDFQHLYNFTKQDHKFVIDKIQQVFGAILCPVRTNLDFLTLENLWKEKFQVFIFYRSDKCPENFWSTEYIPNPWPDTTDPKIFINFLEKNYENGRPLNRFYVTQGVLTPTKSFCLTHFFDSLKSSLARKAHHALFAWLKGKKAGVSGLNVVMFDFVGSSVEIIKYVIQLNYKQD